MDRGVNVDDSNQTIGAAVGYHDRKSLEYIGITTMGAQLICNSVQRCYKWKTGNSVRQREVGPDGRSGERPEVLWRLPA